MFNLKLELSFKFIISISVISLVSAYFIEYFLGYQPCNLCLIERIPYWLSLILIIINFKFKKMEKILIILLIIIFIFSFAISIYHFGIERGFFEESDICGVQNISENISKDQLLKELKFKTISCKDVTFRIMGFSLTSINIIISLFILIILFKNFLNYEKFKS